MATSKLFYCLTSLSNDEWSSYRKYLLMHTSANSDNYKCYEFIRKYKARLEEEDLDTYINSSHFPQMTAKTFANMLSRLFKWFEDWLVTYTLLESKSEKDRLLLQTYNQRALYKLADQKSKQLQKAYGNGQSLDLDNNLTLSKVHHYQYYSNNPIKHTKNNTAFKDALKSFLANTIEYAQLYNLEIHNKKLVSEPEYQHLSSALSQICNIDFQTDMSEIFSKLQEIVTKPNLEEIINLQNRIKGDHLNKSSDTYLIATIIIANSLFNLWRQFDLKDTSVLLTSQNMHIEARNHNKNVKLLPKNLFNAVSNIAVFSSPESTQEFIDFWIDKIYTNDKASVYAYCKMITAFRHNQYEKVFDLAKTIRLEKLETKIEYEAILLITYYKLDKEIFFTATENFRRKINRNKKSIKPWKQKALINLCSALLELNKTKFDKTTQIDLTSYSPLFYKFWFENETKNKSII